MRESRNKQKHLTQRLKGNKAVVSSESLRLRVSARGCLSVHAFVGQGQGQIILRRFCFGQEVGWRCGALRPTSKLFSLTLHFSLDILPNLGNYLG